MAIYARVENDVAVELIDTGDYAIDQLFAPSFVESMVRVPNGAQVEIGAALNGFAIAHVPLLAAPSTVALQQTSATDDAPMETERSWRLSNLLSTEWQVTRHRDEQDLGRGTSLKAAQYLELLEYRQALRDWPDSAHYPAVGGRPSAPAWFVLKAGEQ